MTPITFHRASEFEQTDCAICHKPFQEGARIVQLVACRHLFDQDCFKDGITKCPVCNHSIAGRVRAYTRNEIIDTVDRLAAALSPLAPGIALNPDALSLIKERALELLAKNTVPAIGYDYVAILQNVTKDLALIQSGTPAQLQPIIEKHARHFASFTIDQYFEHPLTLNNLKDELFLLRPEEAALSILTELKIAKLGMAGLLSPHLTTFIVSVVTNAMRDQRIAECFRNRKVQFVETCRSHLQRLSIIQKLYFVNNLAPEHRAIIHDTPEVISLREGVFTKLLLRV